MSPYSGRPVRTPTSNATVPSTPVSPAQEGGSRCLRSQLVPLLPLRPTARASQTSTAVPVAVRNVGSSTIVSG